MINDSCSESVVFMMIIWKEINYYYKNNSLIIEIVAGVSQQRSGQSSSCLVYV